MVRGGPFEEFDPGHNLGSDPNAFVHGQPRLTLHPNVPYVSPED